MCPWPDIDNDIQSNEQGQHVAMLPAHLGVSNPRRAEEKDIEVLGAGCKCQSSGLCFDW